jgi:hypothetical protein
VNSFSCSEFKDIFDLKYFIESLQEYVDIVEALPPHLAKIEPAAKAPISWSKVTFLRTFKFFFEDFYILLQSMYGMVMC